MVVASAMAAAVSVEIGRRHPRRNVNEDDRKDGQNRNVIAAKARSCERAGADGAKPERLEVPEILPDAPDGRARGGPVPVAIGGLGGIPLPCPFVGIAFDRSVGAHAEHRQTALARAAR